MRVNDVAAGVSALLSLLFLSVAAKAQSGAARQMDQREALADRITAINSVLISAAYDAISGARMSELLRERAALLSDAIASETAKSLSLVLPAGAADRLRPLVASDLIESHGEWRGTLEAFAADDFAHHRSRIDWWLRTPNGRFQLFYAKRTPHRPNMTVRVEGWRIAHRIAVVGETAEAGSGEQCATTGPQNIAALVLASPSNPSTTTLDYVRDALFSTTEHSLNTYWNEVSFGLTSAVGDVFGPFTIPDSLYQCSNFPPTGDIATAAFSAAAGAFDPAQYTRFVFLLTGCPVEGAGAGLAQVGCSSQDVGGSPPRSHAARSRAWRDDTAQSSPTPVSEAWIFGGAAAPRDMFVALLSHEAGHNLGMLHAGFVNYGNVPLGDFDAGTDNSPYGDWLDVMGSGAETPLGVTVGHYNAVHKALLGWLDSANVVNVEAPGLFSIAPIESASSGAQALRVRRGPGNNAFLWLEYRQPIGYDQSIGFYSSQPYSGAVLHYDDEAAELALDSSLGSFDDETFLLNFSPPDTSGFPMNPALKAGDTWSDPYSLLTLSVQSANAAGLSVAVGYDQPCATLSGVPASFPAAGTTGTITVSAAAGCSWTASTVAPWITLQPPTSGSGTGTVSFSVSNNDSAGQRNGHINVQRQSIPVVQAGTGITILGMSAGVASGNSTVFTFQFSDAAGYGDITFAELYFSAGSFYYSSSTRISPECEVLVSPPSSIYLFDDSGTQALGPLNLGNPTSSISNSTCTINSTGSSISGAGNQLTVALQIDFTPPFTGIHWVTGEAGNSASDTDLISLGAWTVPAFQPAIGAVVDAATYRAGVIPGSWASMFGSMLAPFTATSAVLFNADRFVPSFKGVEVYMGDQQCSSNYMGNGQINFQVPWEIPAGSQTSKVIWNGAVVDDAGDTLTATSGGVQVTVAPYAPAVFTVPVPDPGRPASDTSLPGAVLDQNYVLVQSTNPAQRGQYIQVFGSGAGSVNPPVPSGQAAPSSPLSLTTNTVTVKWSDGTLTDTSFSGLAPGSVGLYQFNTQVPMSLAPGRVTFSLVENGAVSPPVAIYVQ